MNGVWTDRFFEGGTGGSHPRTGGSNPTLQGGWVTEQDALSLARAHSRATLADELGIEFGSVGGRGRRQMSIAELANSPPVSRAEAISRLREMGFGPLDASQGLAATRSTNVNLVADWLLRRGTPSDPAYERRGSQSQPGNMMVGDVYGPSLSALRAWQQQPVIARTLQTPVHSSAAGMGTDQSTASLQAQEQIIAQPNDDNVYDNSQVPLVYDNSSANQHAQQACFETRCFQQEEERVRDRMTTGPPLHPAPPSFPTPPQPPEAPWKRECVVCYDKEPTMAMIPCFHVCACED